MMPSLIRHPSGFLPVVMSMAAIAAIAVHVALHGTAPQPDEGAAAHVWQLFMAGQLPIVAYFAIKWLPQDRKQAVPVLAVQFAAAVAAVLPVLLLHW